MSFLSIRFGIFLLVLFILYYTLFKKNQWLLLLAGSLVFYFCSVPYFLLYVFFSIFTAYFTALYMNGRKWPIILTLVVNIGILTVLKLPCSSLLMPLGISFYTFMTISYLMDVYWGIIKPEKNFLKYALYILYFPHITQGPIDSYSDISKDLYGDHEFDIVNIKEGLYRLVVGLFKKLVIAGRLAVYVDTVYGSPKEYGGLTLLLATLFYAVQMYCDFSGYMDMAVGASRMFGIKITENFNLPYFSQSIAEYWRRWHITLGAFFRTYVFYPVIRSNMCRRISKSLKGKVSKSFAASFTTCIGLACVWLLTGLWHGISGHYVLHGIYHGLIIMISTLLAGKYGKWKRTLKINEDSAIFHGFRMVRTFILVDISYILFRARSVSDAFYIMKQIFGNLIINSDEIKAAVLPFTGDNTSVSYLLVTMLAVCMLFIAEVFDINGLKFFKKHRYLTVTIMVIMTALFGIFGQSSFLYMAY